MSCRRSSTTSCLSRRTPVSCRSCGAVDAVYAAQIIAGKDFNYTPYVVAGLVFVALTIPMTRLTDWVTARMDRRRAQGGIV